jgi:hypothetical protein
MDKRATIPTRLMATSHSWSNILRSKQSQSVNLRGFGSVYSVVQRRLQSRRNRRLHCIRRAGVNVAVIFVSEEATTVYCRLNRCRQKAVGKHNALGRLESLTL